MVQSMVGWLHCFWVMVRQIVMAEGHRAKLLTPSWLGSRGQKALGTKVHLSRRIFPLGPRPTFQHLPTMPQFHDAIKDESVDEARAPVTQSLPRVPPLNSAALELSVQHRNPLGNNTGSPLCYQLNLLGWGRKEKAKCWPFLLWQMRCSDWGTSLFAFCNNSKLI